MRSKEKDLVRIQHMVRAISLIEEFSKDVSFDQFAEDLMLQSAVIRQFEIIGEASANISNELKERHPDIEWSVIKGFRNLLVHEYFRVDVSEVWSTAHNDLKILRDQIVSILEEEN